MTVQAANWTRMVGIELSGEMGKFKNGWRSRQFRYGVSGANERTRGIAGLLHSEYEVDVEQRMNKVEILRGGRRNFGEEY